MTDEVLSTVITPADANVSGGGAVPLTEPTAPEPTKDEPKGIGAGIKAELEKVRAAERAEARAAKAEAEPKVEKAEVKPSVETADKEAPTPAQAQPDAAASEAQAKAVPAQPDGQPQPNTGKPYEQPPESVAPSARAKWANVPHELKQEWHRIETAHKEAVAEYQEDRKFRDELRDYEEMGKKVNTTVKAALDRYVDFDKRLNDANPMTRAQTVLELMVSSKVDPVAFAREIIKNEHAFAPGQQHQQAAPDPMVRQMAQRLEELNQRFEQQDMQAKAEPLQKQYEAWAADKPDVRELEEDIADILKSGIIQKRYPGLATDQLLTEAYRRAGGAHLTSQADTQPVAVAPSPETPPMRPVNPDAGKKSITGAPTGGKTPLDQAAGKSLRDLLQEEARRKRA